MIVDSLRYWVEEMHVDGFRFDLASILGRDESGKPMPNPPVLWDIESDPVLAGTKLIAEAWDAAGLYQVGSFIGDSLEGVERPVPRRCPQLLPRRRRLGGAVLPTGCSAAPRSTATRSARPRQSVNFVTCHDGFTLNDLVSYNQKHNEANGEDNRDGADDNRSWNCGVEGPTDDPAVEGLRNRQVKNFLTVTMLSLGVPMILMGDEVRRTQRGNNNAYCQDNETSWFDWTLVAKHADVHRFVRLLNARRLLRDEEPERPAPEPEPIPPEGNRSLARRQARAAGLGRVFAQPGIQRAEAPKEKLLFHVILNAYWEPLDFELPPAGKEGTHGADGSTRASTRRRTSSNGRAHRRSRAQPIEPDPALWSCSSLAREASKGDHYGPLGSGSGQKR